MGEYEAEYICVWNTSNMVYQCMDKNLHAKPNLIFHNVHLL